MPWTSGYIKTDRIQLHYHRTGGDKPIIVLAHGLTDSGLCWTRLARALEADYDLIMVDARGHGLSAVPKTGYSTDDHAADLADLVQALDLDADGDLDILTCEEVLKEFKSSICTMHFCHYKVSF